MISNLDYNIYKAIEQEKKLTEIYLGYKEFDWHFSKARYSATCTEAIDFTLFDKTICGLLQIEENLSLEQIGEILGFNVIDNTSENKYKDLAEYEILKEALQSLEEYEMIEGGDIYFSYCTLTSTGKEYVEKGKKFKIHEDKQFELYFDNINNDHAKAKENFEYLKSERISNNNNSIDYENETFLKTFAEHQIPDIYNPEKMNSFKDTILQNITHYKATLYAIFLLDINTGKHRTFVFENTNNKINDYFTEYARNNQDTDIQLFNSFVRSNFKLLNNVVVQKNHIIKLNNYQKKIEIALQENGNFTQILEDYYSEAEFIEPELFFSKLNKFIKLAKNEIWIILNEIDNNILKKLNVILTNKFTNNQVFIFIPQNEYYEEKINDLIIKIDQTINFYIFIADKIEEFNVIYQDDTNWNIYKKEELTLKIKIENQNLFIKKNFVKKNISTNNLSTYIDNFKEMFASKYVNLIIQNAISVLDDNNDILNKQYFENIIKIDEKIAPFTKLTNYSKQISELKKLKEQRINEIKEQRKRNIQKITDTILTKIKNTEQPSNSILEKIKSEIEREKEKCFDFELDLFKDIEKEIIILQKELELINKRKSIIVDTNILIEEPNIIKIIGPNQTIVFSGKVIDELDKLKIRNELKEKAQQAIRNIRRHQKDKNIRFNTSKVANLPDDFDKKSPDNMILSVAIQYKKYNPVLLTNDKGLQIKSEMLEIPAKTIEELKTLLNPKKKGNFKKQQNSNTNQRKNNRKRNKKRK